MSTTADLFEAVATYQSGYVGGRTPERKCGVEHSDRPGVTCQRIGAHSEPEMRPATWLGITDHGAVYGGDWHWWKDKRGRAK